MYRRLSVCNTLHYQGFAAYLVLQMPIKALNKHGLTITKSHQQKSILFRVHIYFS